MANSTIKKIEMFENVETVYSFPYTASHSGILTVFMIQGGTTPTDRSVTIKDTTIDKQINCSTYFSGQYGGTSFNVPVIKGHNYEAIAGSDFVYTVDGRTFLTY